MISSDRQPTSPYGIICRGSEAHNEGCGKQGLTNDEYIKQMNKPNSFWYCPICGEWADWDDERYERVMYPDTSEDSSNA